MILQFGLNIGIGSAACADLLAKFFDLFFDIIKQGMKKDEHIELRGFGTFEVKTREEREARNPKTGESVVVPKRRVPYFRPGKELKAISKVKLP